MGGTRTGRGAVRLRLAADRNADAVVGWRAQTANQLTWVSLDEAADVRLVDPLAYSLAATDAIRQARAEHPGLPIVAVLPDAAKAGEIRLCFRAGAADVLAASEVRTELAAACRRACDGAIDASAPEVPARTRDLEAALGALQASYDGTLNALVSALDLREQETACHSQRVAIYSLLLGMRAAVRGDDLRDLYWGSLLHDIGKIGMPDAVLLKPGSFTDEEWDVMRRHTEMGASLLDGVAFLATAADVPRAHHEAWDGSGYPHGLVAENIPVHARTFAVVDTYDAIRSARPYKAALDHATAIQRIREASGGRLDPGKVEQFALEPETTWSVLGDLAQASPTFHAALLACRKLTGTEAE